MTNSRKTFCTDAGPQIQIIKLKNFQTVKPDDIKKALIMYYTSKGELQSQEHPPEVGEVSEEKQSSPSSSLSEA